MCFNAMWYNHRLRSIIDKYTKKIARKKNKENIEIAKTRITFTKDKYPINKNDSLLN